MPIFTTFWHLIPVTLAQSLIYAFVALGIVMTFRILNFPDLTSEGAFPLGGCVCGQLLTAGFSPLVAVLVATAAGFMAGCFTAFINIRFRINSLLAGILVVTMLYSIDLRILGRSNIALFSYANVFSMLPGPANSLFVRMAAVASALLIIVGFLYGFLKTEKGAAFRATGSNPIMAEAQGINTNVVMTLGVGLAGCLAALGGAFLVQSQGYADVNIGVGVLVGGLAAVIIGEAIIPPRTVLRQLIAPVVGAIVYFQLVSLCLSMGFPPSDLKLATGSFVLIMLALPTIRVRPARLVRLLTRSRMPWWPARAVAKEQGRSGWRT